MLGARRALSLAPLPLVSELTTTPSHRENFWAQLGLGYGINTGFVNHMYSKGTDRTPDNAIETVSNIELPSGTNVSTGAVGADHTCVLSVNGVVFCWGSSAFFNPIFASREGTSTTTRTDGAKTLTRS